MKQVAVCRGELPEEMALHYEAQRKALDNLQRVLTHFGEPLDRSPPALESSNLTRLRGVGTVEVLTGRVRTQHSGPLLK